MPAVKAEYMWNSKMLFFKSAPSCSLGKWHLTDVKIQYVSLHKTKDRSKGRQGGWGDWDQELRLFLTKRFHSVRRASQLEQSTEEPACHATLLTSSVGKNRPAAYLYVVSTVLLTDCKTASTQASIGYLKRSTFIILLPEALFKQRKLE